MCQEQNDAIHDVDSREDLERSYAVARGNTHSDVDDEEKRLNDRHCFDEEVTPSSDADGRIAWESLVVQKWRALGGEVVEVFRSLKVRQV